MRRNYLAVYSEYADLKKVSRKSLRTLHHYLLDLNHLFHGIRGWEDILQAKKECSEHYKNALEPREFLNVIKESKEGFEKMALLILSNREKMIEYMKREIQAYL